MGEEDPIPCSNYLATTARNKLLRRDEQDQFDAQEFRALFTMAEIRLRKARDLQHVKKSSV